MQNIGEIAARAMPRAFAGQDIKDWSGNSDWARRAVSDLILKCSDWAEEQFHANVNRCESPIECVALAGILVLFPRAVVAETGKALKECEDEWTFGIVPQMKFKGYRLDFAVFNKPKKTIHSLECDGFAFHRDKRREVDRDVNLWRHGVITFHVSGSSLYRNPMLALEPFGDKVRQG